MADLLLPNVDDALVELLEARATRHGRSAEAELRAIVDESLRGRHAAFAGEAERLVSELQGRRVTDSAAIIRADRDRDGAMP